jgi:uncharacterized SAM-binding protein YcdF (DUF218 family)
MRRQGQGAGVATNGPSVHPNWASVGDAPAVCVLGCRSGSAALARRARAGCDAFFAKGAPVVVACGGLEWAGTVEADAIARILGEGGVPVARIALDRRSRDTRENASEAARLLAERGLSEVVLVTCSWHLRRATGLFEEAGLVVVDGIGVEPVAATWLDRLYWAARERVAAAKDRFGRGAGRDR